MNSQPRLRMFAGPNGSGKSTVKSVIKSSLLGFYINPDEIEQRIKETDLYDLRGLPIQTNRAELITFFEQSGLSQKLEFPEDIQLLRYQDGIIYFHDLAINSYLSAILADFLRHKFLEAHQSFTFETVMSSADKIALLKKAQALGFRTYLYYVSTDDPQINIARVAHRVRMGGHNVPTDKIISRYYRSLDLLYEAIRYTDRTYLFDNSGETKRWVASITDGKIIDIQSASLPEWFRKYILEKIKL